MPLAALALAAVSTLPAQAAVVSAEVFAQGNSTTGGSLLDTGIDLVAGDRLVSMVATDDCWAAGGGSRTSNADGLVGTAGACQPSASFGLHTQGGVSLPFGTLVGRIGAAGTFFALGTAFDASVTSSGRLFLGYWDSNSGDNSGSVTARLEVNPGRNDVPVPATLWLAGAALGLLAASRRR